MRKLLRRPLRSVMLCEPRYLSAYVIGVAQAMGMMGHWHRQVSLWDGGDVGRQIAEMAPDVVWTHMAAWPPKEALAVEEVAALLATAKRRGAVVFLHDGDPRDRAMPPAVDIPAAFTMALVNRQVPDPYWGIPSVRWPYAAMVQREAVRPERVDYDLAFAGNLRRQRDGEAVDLYGARTDLVHELHRRLWPRMSVVSPGGGDTNNRMQVADVVATTHAVLGFGRPEVSGWIDTRVFQWPGAGGLLITDDAGDVLEPDVHYLRFDRANAVDSILWLLERAKGPDAQAIRDRAFAHVQRHHTWAHRVKQALAPFFGDVG